MNRRKIKKQVSRVLLYAAVILVCFTAIFPYLWMVLVSLKEKVFVYQPGVIFFKPTFENYINVFKTRGLGGYLINSVIIASLNCIISLFLGSLTAYALARYEFRNREKYALLLTFIRILPAVASVIPIYVVAASLRILDTHGLLITVYLLFNIPFTVLMMRGFFEEIPVEIEEAAKVDGCTSLQLLTKIVIPLAKPGLVATAIFCVINAWNEFMFGYIFISTDKYRTLTPAIMLFKGANTIDWGGLMAGSVIAVIPVTIIFLFLQKYFLAGLMSGSVKG